MDMQILFLVVDYNMAIIEEFNTKEAAVVFAKGQTVPHYVIKAWK